MPNLLAMSFEGALAPSFDLRCLHPGRKPPDGWGIGYYPGGEPSATVLKEPAPPVGSIRSELVKAWEHLESSLFHPHPHGDLGRAHRRQHAAVRPRVGTTRLALRPLRL